MAFVHLAPLIGGVIGIALLASFIMTPSSPTPASVTSLRHLQEATTPPPVVAPTAPVDTRCVRPKNFCDKPTMTYEERDCDGDAVPDPYCSGEGYCGCVGSSEGCKNDWPKICVGGRDKGQHLPALVPPEGVHVVPITTPNTSSGTWYLLMRWEAELDDNVTKGDVIAVVQPFLADGTYDSELELTATHSGIVLARQKLRAGSVIGAGDAVALVGKETVEEVQAIETRLAARRAFPWWIVAAALGVCCILLLIYFFCCGKAEAKPAPSYEKFAVIETPTKVKQEEETAPLLLPPENPEISWHRENPVVFLPPGVPLDFDGKTYQIEYRPLGISFHQKAPITIDEFVVNSYAKYKGLKEGMRLTKIRDYDVHGGQQYKDVHHHLLAALEPLPVWPLRVDFKTETGMVRHFKFQEKPLGIQFNRSAPIKVDRVKQSSLAQEKGVQVGWQIVKIADEDVSYNHDYEHVNHLLGEGMRHLPQRDLSKTRSGSTPERSTSNYDH